MAARVIPRSLTSIPPKWSGGARWKSVYGHDPHEAHGLSNVLRTGAPEVYPEITDEMLVHNARDEEHLSILRRVGFNSALACCSGPGAGCWAPSRSSPLIWSLRYGPEELQLAEDLVGCAAVALDNARLFQEVQEAGKRKDEFLAMLAHELRNPLASIRSAVEVFDMPGAEGHLALGQGGPQPAGQPPGPPARRPAGRLPHHPRRRSSCARSVDPSRPPGP